MTDPSKLHLIHEALDDGRDPLLLEGLDSASVKAAEELAAVDAWLRGCPAAWLADDAAEALAARIEAELGKVSLTDAADDPLAAPDFSVWGDLDERGLHDAEAGGSVVRESDAVLEERARVVPIGIRAAATAPVSGAESPPVLASGDRASSADRGAPRRAAGRAAAFRAFVASAAVVLLAAIGTFVAHRSASSPNAPAPVATSRPAAAAPSSAEGLAEPLEEAEAPPRSEPSFEAVAREQGVVARASRGSSAPSSANSAAPDDALSVDGAQDRVPERAPGASRRARVVSSAEPLASAAPVGATPAVATPAVATPAVATPAVATPAVATPAVAASMASARSLSEGGAGGGLGVASTGGGSTEDALAGDVAADAEVDVRSRAWTQRVFACVPTTTRTLSTDVAIRAGTIVRVTSIRPTLDDEAVSCIRRVIVGQRQGLDRARMRLRWTRP